jgi:hypothetical protein
LKVTDDSDLARELSRAEGCQDAIGPTRVAGFGGLGYTQELHILFTLVRTRQDCTANSCRWCDRRGWLAIYLEVLTYSAD